MKKISFKIDNLCCNVDDFLDYMNSIKGIYDVKIDKDNEEIYMIYNSDVISIELLKKEILLFLNLLSVPSINGFDKYFTKELCEYRLVIKDLCCEYCLRSMIEELVCNSGIGRVNYNFNNVDVRKDVLINIFYDSDLIDKSELVDIEYKFNLKDC